MGKFRYFRYFSEEQYNTFINNYKIENNNINIKYINGDVYIIPYTKENEKNILNKLEEQVKTIERPKIKKDEVFCLFLDLGLLLFNLVHFFSTCIPMVKIACLIPIIVAMIGIFKLVEVMLSKNVQNKDIDKLKYFIEHKEEINDNLKKNENVLSGIKVNSQNFIKEKIDNNESLEITDVDGFTHEELKKIVGNIDKIKYLKEHILSNNKINEQLDCNDKSNNIISSNKINDYNSIRYCIITKELLDYINSFIIREDLKLKNADDLINKSKELQIRILKLEKLYILDDKRKYNKEFNDLNNYCHSQEFIIELISILVQNSNKKHTEFKPFYNMYSNDSENYIPETAEIKVFEEDNEKGKSYTKK